MSVSLILAQRGPDRTPIVKIKSGSRIDGFCTVIVEDNGIGFDEKYLERIFKPFERLHGKGEFKGTGMGLAICAKIVDNHGGKLTANSVPGEGSRFIVKLPEVPPRKG